MSAPPSYVAAMPVYIPAGYFPADQTKIGQEGNYPVSIPLDEIPRGEEGTTRGNVTPFGDLKDFLSGIVFGTFAPIFSQLTLFSFETSRLTRLGSLFGTAHLFILIGLVGIVFGVQGLHGGHDGNWRGHHGHSFPGNESQPQNATQPDDNSTVPYDVRERHDRHPSRHGEHNNGQHGREDFHGIPHQRALSIALITIASVVLLAGIIIRRMAKKRFNIFLFDYSYGFKTSQEIVHVTSEKGTQRDYRISLVVSILFSILGAAIRLWRNKTLKSKHGIMRGIAFHMLLSCLSFPMMFIPAMTLLATTEVHFQRAYISMGDLTQPEMNQCATSRFRRFFQRS